MFQAPSKVKPEKEALPITARQDKRLVSRAKTYGVLQEKPKGDPADKLIAQYPTPERIRVQVQERIAKQREMVDLKLRILHALATRVT